MNEIIFSANIVLPLLLLMVFGYCAKQRNLISDETVAQNTSLAFTLFIPILLFNNIRNSTFVGDTALKLSLFSGGITLVFFFLFTLAILLFEKDNPTRGVMIQGVTRSNYALFGLPLVSMLFPNQDVSIAAILIAVVVPIYNVLSVLALSYFCSSNGTTAKQVLINIAKNPLIIASVTGIFFLFAPFNLPIFLDTALTDVAKIASPFALFILGASFQFEEVGPIAKQISFSVIFKIIITPLIAVPLAILCGFRDVELGCVIALACSPTSVSSFPMAVKMGGNKALASSLVLFSSFFSIFTIFITLVLVKWFQFI
ncbi:MAG: AEC family transporter [Eubacteriales bacterium]